MLLSFSEIQHQVEMFLDPYTQNCYNLDDTNYKLPLSDALFCAQDRVRNKKFFQAIASAIADISQKEKDIIVVDAGSGSGILGLFAVLHGAKKCYFLEHNPHSLELSKKLLAHFGFSQHSIYIECDACSYDLPEKFDLLISETITSGFIAEDFPQIISHLQKFSKKDARIIPEKFIFSVEEKISGKYTNTHTFEFLSSALPEKQNLTLQNTNSSHLRFSAVCTLHKDIQISSEESMSFLAPREVSLPLENSFWEIQSPKTTDKKILRIYSTNSN